MSWTDSHCLALGHPHRVVDAPVNPLSRQRYMRMFPGLPRFTAEEAFLYALGRQGGVCDCGADHDEPTCEAEGAAGWPIFGQFMAAGISDAGVVARIRRGTLDGGSMRSHDVRPAAIPRSGIDALTGDGNWTNSRLNDREPQNKKPKPFDWMFSPGRIHLSSVGGVQRRSDRDPHHNYGAGDDGASWTPCRCW